MKKAVCVLFILMSLAVEVFASSGFVSFGTKAGFTKTSDGAFYVISPTVSVVNAGSKTSGIGFYSSLVISVPVWYKSGSSEFRKYSSFRFDMPEIAGLGAAFPLGNTADLFVGGGFYIDLSMYKSLSDYFYLYEYVGLGADVELNLKIASALGINLGARATYSLFGHTYSGYSNRWYSLSISNPWSVDAHLGLSVAF